MEPTLNTETAPSLLFAPAEQDPVRHFVLYFPHQLQNLCVEVVEIAMEGWMLYECFLQHSNQALYISWDHGSREPEWVEMEPGKVPEFAYDLMDAIVSYKTTGAIL